MTNNMLKVEDALGQVFRHKRLFNFLVTPITYTDGIVTCISGKDSMKHIPVDYFKREWKQDKNICADEFLKKLTEYPSETSGTIIFNDCFEQDDGKPHTYLYFDDHFDDDIVSFPLWKIAVYTKEERDNNLNPFTIIMPLVDDKLTEIQKELDIINELRCENEFLGDMDYQGFELSLIKFLEKKYLREI